MSTRPPVEGRPAAAHLLVDGFNVIGTRPTGWWRDRGGAARRLHRDLERLAARAAERITLVLDGPVLDDLVAHHGRVPVVFAPGGRNAADRRIVALVAAAPAPDAVAVVTADRALREDVEALGATIVPPTVLLARLDALAEGCKGAGCAGQSRRDESTAWERSMDQQTALIVVDVQNDFCEGGSLPVPGGRAAAARIAEHVRRYGEQYAAIAATRDWHEDPGDHFAPAGSEPDFATTWPVHCLARGGGAAFDPAMQAVVDEEHVDAIFDKGRFSAAYSGFEGSTARGERLADWLRERDVVAVDVCGIATDYCVAATAIDAAKAGFETRVLLDLCAGVASASTADAIRRMESAGVRVGSAATTG